MKTIKRSWKVTKIDDDCPFLDIPLLKAVSLAEKKLKEDAKKLGLKIIKIEHKSTGPLSGQLIATVEQAGIDNHAMTS